MNKSSSRTLKATARRTLGGHYPLLVLSTLLLVILNLFINFVLNSVFGYGGGMLSTLLYLACTFLTNVIYYLLLAGQQRIYLKLGRGQEATLGDMAFAFSTHPEAIAGYSVLQCILQTILYNGLFLLMTVTSPLQLLIMAAGALVYVWLQLGLAAVLYLYNESPWKSGRELIRDSWQLMRGSRMRLFGLRISFIGMDLLALLSFGLGLLWVEPYTLETQTLFFMELDGD